MNEAQGHDTKIEHVQGHSTPMEDVQGQSNGMDDVGAEVKTSLEESEHLDSEKREEPKETVEKKDATIDTEDEPGWLRNHTFERTVELNTHFEIDSTYKISVFGVVPPNQLRNFARQNISLLSQTGYVRIFIFREKIRIENFIVDVAWNMDTMTYKCSKAPEGLAPLRILTSGYIPRMHRKQLTLKTRR